MNNNENIVKMVLDVGSNKIKGIVGMIHANTNELEVLKYVEFPSRGVIKGEVKDSEALSRVITKVVDKLKDGINEEIEIVTTGISGENIKSRTKNVEIRFEEKEIENSDIEALIAQAEKEILDDNCETLKAEIYNLRVDNSGIVKNPVGIVGGKLYGDVHLIYVEKTAISKLVESFNKSSLNVENILLNAYASAKSTLDIEDRKMGVALVDIGEGTTDIILYKNDKIIYTESVPLGGMHFKSDLMYMFKMQDKDEPQEILDKYRCGDITPNGNIIYGDDNTISVKDLEEIIEARVDEIIKYIDNTIKKSGFNGYLGKGLILTGGLIEDKLMDAEKMLDKISKKTGYVSRTGQPYHFKGLKEIHKSMATVVGLFYDVMEKEIKNSEIKDYVHQGINVKNERFKSQIIEPNDIIREKTVKNKKTVFGKIKDWLSNFI